MKKFRSIATILILSVVIATLCTMLSACNDGFQITKIYAENYQETFSIGDEFSCGDDFKVYAEQKDGKKIDVTEQASIRKEVGMDMDTAGEYLITVLYGGKSFGYTITVSSFDILSRLSVDSTNAQTAYKIGDTLSTDGLSLSGTYVSNVGGSTQKPIASLSGFEVSVYDASGKKQGTSFGAEGTYTVRISKGSVSTSYQVTVSGARTDSVEGAISVGKILVSGVSQGTLDINTVVDDHDETETITYKFGDKCTYVNAYGFEYHYSLTPSDTVNVTTLENGDIVPSNPAPASVMGGAPYKPWYANGSTVYGIEAILEEYYKIGKQYATLCESQNGYSYSFSYGNAASELQLGGSAYFTVDAQFTLNTTSHSIESATVVQRQYPSSEYTENGGVYSLKVGAVPSKQTTLICTQTIAARTYVNPYYGESSTVSGFKLSFKGIEVANGGSIALEVGKNEVLKISDITPVGASFDTDEMYFGDGSQTVNSVSMLFSSGYYAYRETSTSSDIELIPQKGGTFQFIVKTRNVTKTVTLKITGAPPTSLTSEVFNGSNFNARTKITVAVGEEVLFRAACDSSRNGAYGVNIVEGSGGLLTNATAGSVECYAFSSQTAGTYKIKMTSEVAPSVYCELTVSVVLPPDYNQVFSGRYLATDAEGNEYSLTFVSHEDCGDHVTATLAVTKTLVGGASSNEVLSCSAQKDGMTIVLTHESGANLGIDLVFGEGVLYLDDYVGNWYELEK